MTRFEELKARDKTNCPNCGAPIEHRYNHKCPYCNTFFDYRVEHIEEINPRYLKNVKLRYVEQVPYEDCFVLVFRGDYVKWQEAIEYGSKNTTIVLSTDDIKPKEINYAIKLNFKELMQIRQSDFEPLFKKLPFEIDKYLFIKAIKEKLEPKWL